MQTHKINYTVKFPDAIESTIQTIVDNGGDVYLVGGAVRDIAMNNFNFKDYDFEVFNMQPETLAQLLKCDLSGNAFAVFNVFLDNMEVQFSIPRSEIKNGTGYNGFDVKFDPFMTIENAAKRRDFTFNAMYINVNNRSYIIDPFDGMNDIRLCKIRPIDYNVFKEDPVRILRAIQFAGRLGYSIANVSEFINSIKHLQIELNSEPSERFIIEVNKLLSKSIDAMGIGYLDYIAQFINFFKFIDQMNNQEHCEIYHKEGNVWQHTKYVMYSLIQLRNDEFPIELSTMWAALFHDYGKVYTSKLKGIIDGKKRITTIGHETKSVELFDMWCDEFAPQFDRVMRNRIKLLIAKHMVDAPEIKRLSVVHGKEFAMQLTLFIWADQIGRRPIGEKKAGEMKQLYKWFQKNTIVPIVTGKTLIEYGYKQNKQFGDWLNILLKAQIRGTLNESNVEQMIKSVCGKIN